MPRIIAILYVLSAILYAGCGGTADPAVEPTTAASPKNGQVDQSDPDAPAAELEADFVGMERDLDKSTPEMEQERTEAEREAAQLKQERAAVLAELERQRETASDGSTRDEQDADPATIAPDVNSEHHASSRKVLWEASAAAAEWKAEPGQDVVEQFRELQQRRYLLIDVALAQAESGDVTGVEAAMTRHRQLKNAARELEGLVANGRRTLDEADVDLYVALAVAHARSGNPNAADAALSRLTDKNVVIVGSPDVVRAKVLANVAIAHAERGDQDAASSALNRLGTAADRIEEPFVKARVLGQLAKAQATIGLVADARKTVESLAALEAERNGSRTAINEALAGVSRAQAASGDVTGAKQTLSKVDQTSIFADSARFDMATLYAQALDFRSALETANNIANEILKARAIVKILDAQLACGPNFQKSAWKLSNLVKQAVESHKSNPTFHKQLRTDAAVAAVKWRGIAAVLPDSFSGPPSAVAAMQQMRQTSITARATIALLELEADDLKPEQKAQIALAAALNSAEQKKTEEARQFFSQALEFAEDASDLAEQSDILAAIERGFVHVGRTARGREAAAARSDSLSRSALLLGIGKGLYAQPFQGVRKLFQYL